MLFQLDRVPTRTSTIVALCLAAAIAASGAVVVEVARFVRL